MGKKVVFYGAALQAKLVFHWHIITQGDAGTSAVCSGKTTPFWYQPQYDSSFNLGPCSRRSSLLVISFRYEIGIFCVSSLRR